MIYTYMWLREDGTPYYIGKGKGNRGFRSKGHAVRRPCKRERIIVQEWPSDEDAFAAERFLIAYYGRLDLGLGCLRNRSNGGDGLSGISEETRERMKSAAKSRPHAGGLQRGCTPTPTMLENLKRGQVKGRIFSAEHRQKLSESKIGQTWVRPPIWPKGKPRGPLTDAQRISRYGHLRRKQKPLTTK